MSYTPAAATANAAVGSGAADSPMNFDVIRHSSVTEARRLGYPQPASLPLASELTAPRGAEEIALRCLSLYAVLFSLFADDVPKPVVRDWMAANGLETNWSSLERRFLGGEQLSEDELDRLSDRVESANALCWALGKTAELSPANYVDENLDALFPDIRGGESSDLFMRSICIREVEDLIQATDLYYVLHWGITEESLCKRPRPGNVDAYVIVERRHALEWIMCDLNWDDVSLDT